MRWFIITFFFSFMSFISYSQDVSTFANAPSTGDVAVDHIGNVYVAQNNSIFRISPEGVLDSEVFATGANFSNALGLEFNNTKDTLYVTNRPNGAGWITQVTLNGESNIFSTNLNYPGDVTFSDEGQMYVCEFNNTIRKVDSEGNSEVYVQDNVINTPIGFAWTPGDTLYIASAHDGNVYKVSPTSPTPTVEWHAHVDGLVQNWACGFMTYGNGALYITNGDDKVHQITLDGIVSDYAGTGVNGSADGIFAEAEFQAPNGIGFNADESEMYVCEWGMNRVRKLTIPSLGLSNDPSPIDDIRVFPNPAQTDFNLKFNMKDRSSLIIQLIDLKGNRVLDIDNGDFSKGEYALTVHIPNELANGMYFVQISDSISKTQRKISVLR